MAIHSNRQIESSTWIEHLWRRLPTIVQPEPLRRTVANARLQACVNQRCDGGDVSLAFSSCCHCIRWFEEDTEASIRLAGTPRKYDRRTCTEVYDCRPVCGAGSMAEKRHEHIAGILIRQNPYDLPSLETL